MPIEPTVEEKWYKMLTEGETIPLPLYHFFGHLPADPRCKLCAAPFRGWGGFIMRLMGRSQSQYNPRFCQPCEPFDNPGGAEVELTMFFADVRGSTTLAETMSASEFGRLMNRFYALATRVLVNTDAMVDRLIGDQVIGLYIPGLSGKQHARKAVAAAQELLQLTGHRDPKGPWLPVGVGLHTGLAFVGIVGGEGGNPKDFTALGDNVNITARLSSLAGPGEILVSETTSDAASLEPGLENRQLQLKGRSGTFPVNVLRVAPA